jgi:hypothetical protein
VLPLHLVPFVVEHSPGCERTNTGQYGVNLAAGAPATEMGTHAGDRHGAGASDGEGARAGDAHGWGHGRRPALGGRCAPDGGAPDGDGVHAAHQTERAHGPGTLAGGGEGGGWHRAGVEHR